MAYKISLLPEISASIDNRDTNFLSGGDLFETSILSGGSYYSKQVDFEDVKLSVLSNPVVVSGVSYSVPSDISYSATIIPDFSVSNVFKIELTGDIILANPINTSNGANHIIIFKQDATGSRDITSYGDMYTFADGVELPLTTTADRCDILSCIVDDDKLRCILITNFS